MSERRKTHVVLGCIALLLCGFSLYAAGLAHDEGRNPAWAFDLTYAWVSGALAGWLFARASVA